MTAPLAGKLVLIIQVRIVATQTGGQTEGWWGRFLTTPDRARVGDLEGSPTIVPVFGIVTSQNTASVGRCCILRQCGWGGVGRMGLGTEFEVTGPASPTLWRGLAAGWPFLAGPEEVPHPGTPLVVWL